MFEVFIPLLTLGDQGNVFMPPPTLCFRVVRACVRVCVLACLRASVKLFINAFTEKLLKGFDEIFTSYPSRSSHELIGFSPYLVNFQGNYVAKYGKILTF